MQAMRPWISWRKSAGGSKAVDEKLQADLDQLKLKYEGNRDLKDKLTQYERLINPSYLNSPMWKYAKPQTGII